MAALGYLLKLKRDLGLAFGGAHFLHDFSRKTFLNYLILYLSMDKVSMSYFFPSQDIKQNVLLIIWTVDGIINFKIYL